MPAIADTRSVTIIALAYATSFAVYSILPEPHWLASAPFPPELARPMIAFFLPSAAAAIYLLLNRLVTEPDAGKAAAKRFYSGVVFTLFLSVIGLHAIVLIGLLGGAVVASHAAVILLGLVFVVMGNLLPRTRPNPIVGIRVPATLANREVWMRVNRFAGYVSVMFGTALVASVFVQGRRGSRDLASVAAAIALVALVVGYRKYSQPIAIPQPGHPIVFGLTGWLLRVPVVLIFLYFGAIKLPARPDSPWSKLFAQIGVGQWLRYFTGVLEVVSAILLLIPRTSLIAASALVCTMVAAILTHILVIGVGPAILVPIILLVLLTLILQREYIRTRG